MSNRWFCYTNSLFDQGLGDHKSISTTWNHFENFLIPFWILKIFCNPKIILKIFVIQIQFWNWFQTIEVQVIRKNGTMCKFSQASCLLLQENASFLVVLMMMIILDDFWVQKNASVSIFYVSPSSLVLVSFQQMLKGSPDT